MIEYYGFLITCSDDNNNWEELINSLSNYDESVEEMEKLAFICSCAIDSVKAGGSVLIPINRVGVFLQLLEQIAIFMECSSLKVYNQLFCFKLCYIRSYAQMYFFVFFVSYGCMDG